jgi:outer membrane protein, heavy metal efflux system
MTRDIVRTILCAAWIAAGSASGAERIEHLTLERALELAEQHHPDLAEARAASEAARARRAQAGKLANPEAVARIESAPLDRRTADSAEYVAGVSQSVPLGGRLSAERTVAERELEAAQARIELRRRELHSRVQGAFATALYFDAAQTALSNNLAGAEALTRIARARVEAGDALREDLARAEIEALQARLEMKAAEAARRLAMSDLVGALGQTSLEIGALRGSLTNALALPQIEAAAKAWANSPAVAVAKSEAAAHRARIELAKAQRIPDINFDLFYRRLQETRQDAFDAGLRVPIPLFAGARVRVREARADSASADARLESTRLESRQQFRRALAELNGALDAARLIGTEVLPRAQLVLTSAEARYRAGDASLAEVLQRRREWHEFQTTYLDALRQVHEAWRGVSQFGGR